MFVRSIKQIFLWQEKIDEQIFYWKILNKMKRNAVLYFVVPWILIKNENLKCLFLPSNCDDFTFMAKYVGKCYYIYRNVRVEKGTEKRPRKFQVQLRKLGQKGF